MFLGTSVRPYGRTVSRTYVQKKRMSDKTKDSLLVISDNFRLKVCDFFFDGTFRWPPYCSYDPCGARGGQAAMGSTLLFTNFLRRTTFLCRYMRFFFRYVPPYILGYVIRSFFRFAVTCSKKAGQKKIPFYKLVETDNFCL